MEDGDFIHWLLNAGAPSIRYWTLRHLLGRAEADAKVRSAWEEMHTTGPITAILAGQTETGRWSGERSYYTPKYTSTHWSMLLLAELAADGADPRLRRGADSMLTATLGELEKVTGGEEHGLSCFWGNVLRYTLHCGFGCDPRVALVIDYLVRDAQVGGWRCAYNDELPCAWGAARALWGLAALPLEQRSAAVASAVELGLGFLLEAHSLIDASYPARRKVHPLWFRLNFPLFYQADILFVLRVLAELGALDHPGARPALEWLVSRRKANGRWRGSSPYRQRTWDALADHEDTDRWVSLHAAIVLKQAADRGS